MEIHGYSRREAGRLLDQARTLAGLLHHDTGYPPGSRVLEAGCGIGAQTVTLAEKSPGASVTSIDLSEASLREAEARVRAAKKRNVAFRQADIHALPFPDGSDRRSLPDVPLCSGSEYLRNRLGTDSLVRPRIGRYHAPESMAVGQDRQDGEEQRRQW